MDFSKIYVHQTYTYCYPDKGNFFNPSISYPEYKFTNDISESDNYIYDSVRECLYKMGLDQDHFGTKDWNPLGELIKPGNVVLLKPNMVLHENEKPGYGTECLITHPSLVRAILDYVVIALQGLGSIVVGDAPLQSCDFEKLIHEQGYVDIIEFYRKRDVNVALVDFRNIKTIYSGGILRKAEGTTFSNSIVVDLGGKSEFGLLDYSRSKRFRITNYDHSEMYKHHNGEKNEYLIAQTVLQADVIINLPKPKTHRKAGVTISLKNLIGINTNKECLPHHSEGSVEEGGDEYLYKSFIKKLKTYLIEKKDQYMTKESYMKAKLLFVLSIVFSVLLKFFGKDKYYEGSWYGNDTIWRTILDLNKIVFYADKQGTMQETKQREMLIIADMIISGEEEGPLLPTPKGVGIIAMGFNPVSFDEAIASIMGFSPSFIPSICNARNITNYIIADPRETEILSNNDVYNKKKISDIHYEDSLKFKPSYGWKNLILSQSINSKR